MIRTQIQLTEQQAQTLKALAKAQGVSVADLIRRGVDHILHTELIAPTEERYRRALAAVGRFRSDVTDLAAEHDRYSTGAYSN